MDKYMLFGFDYYYPSGGLNDLLTTFNNVEEFHQKAPSGEHHVYQILNVVTGSRKTVVPSGFDELLSWQDTLKAQDDFLSDFVRNFIKEED